MEIKNISLPEIYKTSDDFRFFVNWISESFGKVKYDTENVPDLYDPLRCKSELLWLLCDTMGFKYDERLCTAFNRLVLLYFMSMIRNRGSMDGVKLGASVNLAQFNVNAYGEESEINYDRLEDSSIPANGVYVTPHTAEGYIEIVYFSNELPIDACIEYVRPLGMYAMQYAGVRFDGKTRISIDARLTNIDDLSLSIGATHIGHYRREDYARLQRMYNEQEQEINPNATRHPVYYRNSKLEGEPNPEINAGYRTLYSLQLCNDEHMVKSLLTPIFGLGYTPQFGELDRESDDYTIPSEQNASLNPNLRYDRNAEESLTEQVYTVDVYDYETGKTVPDPKTKLVPRVNTIYSVSDSLDG